MVAESGRTREEEGRVMELIRKVAGGGEGPTNAAEKSGWFTEREAFEGAESAGRLVARAGGEVGLWGVLAAEGVKPASIARGFSSALSSGPGGRARLELSRFYAALLALDGSPAQGLFEEIAWSCAIASVRTHFAAEGGSVEVLENLTKAISERLNLNAFESTITTTIEALAPLSREVHAKSVSEDGSIEVEITGLWEKSLLALFRFLVAVVKSGEGIRSSSAVVLMRSLQPVLALEVSNRKAPTKVKQWLRQGTLGFLRGFSGEFQGDGRSTASKAVGALARHCCIKAPENAEAREHGSSSVASLASFLPSEQAAEFVLFLTKMFRHPQTNQRVFALEVAQRLAEICFQPGDSVPQGFHLDLTTLVQGILDRALDKAGFIRVKAITCVSSIVCGVCKRYNEDQANLATKVKDLDAIVGESMKRKVIALAIGRSKDSKPAVRKAALSLLENVLPLCEGIDSKSVQAITSASHDAYVSVRKQAAVAASSLYNSFRDKEFSCRMWLQVVLPLSLDAEPTIQNKCKESFQKEFLNSISCGSGGIFLRLLELENNFALLFRKVMNETKFTHSQLSKVARVLQESIQKMDDASTEAGHWIVLSEVVAKYPSLLKGDFIQGTLKKLDAYIGEPKTLARVMQTTANCAKSLDRDFSLEMCKVVTQRLRTFSVPIDAISYCLATLHQLSQTLSSSGDGTCANFVSSVAQGAEQFFKESMEEKNLVALQKELASAIYTMGELSLLKSFHVSAGVVTLVQGMTSDRLLGSGVCIPHAILAHSWACLGKFCHGDEELAKRFIPLFFHEIKNTNISAVRNNIMLILADLCTKYTSLVDVHIGEIAQCFHDPSEMVRRQTLIALASLLQQDFLKWRGPIFHCFLLSLVDDSKAVQSLGNFLLSTSLSHKASLLAYNFFVQTLFALNGHSSHTNLAMGVESQTLVTTNIRDLAGSDEASRQKRCVIYHHLLKRMAPEHKFQIAAKLCEDCIGHFVENTLDFDTHSEVLRDTLVVLSSKEIKADIAVQSFEAEEDRKLAFAAVKGKLISAMMKKHLIGAIVPLIIELKGILEARKSPLLGILLNFACAVLKEHKEEVEEILVADNTFAKEVLYEMQQENKSRQPLIRPPETPGLESPILKGNTFSTPVAPATASRSPLPVGTSSKTPLAAEVLQEEGMVTARSVQINSEKKYLGSTKTSMENGENLPRENSAKGGQEEGKSNNEVRRLSSLFNAAAD
ncbi:subunit D3 of condensin-2 complex [Chloropicon primus]|uniref:Subunit D3 of condensin-2 complex n=1 Tax=Chloropicon primus TaxID=1764295 RepID=A0A5B8MB44_9CHLO|nr:subunit D3 of condensin-2 complex [Chloropicon primus]UPQ96814.1 subunit D3 of condensin-2 complex [Chloropicon primus]|eukprot:QDZ17596.1 subunit D3 of condensin-2 complex [Chloropicon primus]